MEENTLSCDFQAFNDAIGRRDFDEVRRSHKAEFINMKDGYGETSLHIACSSDCGDINIVKHLLDKGFDIEVQSMNKDRPIHLAAFYGHKSVVEELIIRRCILTAVNTGGETAMEVSARRGLKETENILYKAMKKDRNESIDEYILEKELGHGAYGVVYMAQHKETNNIFAIKKFIRLNNRELLESVEREIEIYKILPLHEHIVRYYGSIKGEYDLYIIMECIDGITLRSKLNEVCTLNIDVIADYTRQILEGIDFLHKNNILHRDIKSSNILIERRYKIDVIKLCDFGSSRFLKITEGTNETGNTTDTEIATTSIGTEFYMAPEVFNGPSYSFSADIWSLGATVFEMFTGQPPYYDDGRYNARVAIASLKKVRFDPNIPIPNVLKSFMDSMFVADPDKRATVKALLESEFLNKKDRNESIEEYIIEKELGHGRYGVVYKARHKGTNKIFALKKLIRLNNDEFSESVEKEIEIYKKLPLHEHIIRYYGSIKGEYDIDIIMEYIDGVTLRYKLNEWITLPINYIVGYTRQILEGIDFLHKNNIIHRDIKSSNILIGSGYMIDVIKLCDFGSSHFLKNTESTNETSNTSDIEMETTSIGTEFYMAPEVFNGSSNSFSADIWSLGSTVFEMFTGRLPHYDGSNLSAYTTIENLKIVQFDPIIPIPEDLKRFMDLMFVVEPDKRATVEALLESEFFNKRFVLLPSAEYTDIEFLGSGIFGDVYKYLDNRINKYFVIRRIHVSYIFNEIAVVVNSLRHKINKNQQLSIHPNITQYYGTIIDRFGRLCIGTEFMEAGSLRQKLDKETKLSVNTIARYTKQILEGLKFLHLNNIIHGNIKAANVMLDSKDNVKLCDFGIQMVLYRIRMDSMLEGDVKDYVTKIATKQSYWMAPEINVGTEPTICSDVWSLGATVVEMLTGNPPYHEFDPVEVEKTLRITKKFDYKFKPWIPNNLNLFMDSIFVYDPEKRVNVESLLESQFISEYYPRDNEVNVISEPLMTTLSYFPRETKNSYENKMHKRLKKCQLM